MHRRQAGIPEPPSPTASSAQTTTPVSVNIIIPTVAVVGGLIVVAAVYACRGWLAKVIRKHISIPNTSRALINPSTSSGLTAEQLASGSLVSVNRLGRPLSGTSGPGEAAQGGSRHAAQRGARAQRRGIRRTDSGQSVRTLPAYSKEAGDEELVLVRKRSVASVVEEEELDSEGDAEDAEMTQRSLLPAATLPRAPSIRSTHSTAPDAQSPTAPANPHAQEVLLPGRPSEEILSAPVRGAIDRTSIARRGWGEAPTYLEAMSSPAFPPDVERDGGVPPPRSRTPTGLRERTSSTFQNLLSRAGFSSVPTSSLGQRRRPSSQSSLLLQPQTSRLSTQSTSSQGASLASPNASTHSLVISSPLPNTAVRASFDSAHLPRAGLSEQQMRYLSSSEALQTAGIPLADPPRGRRRGSSAAGSPSRLLASPLGGPGGGRPRSGSEAGQPPSWTELDERRRREEAEARRDWARPALGTSVRHDGPEDAQQAAFGGPSPWPASHGGEAGQVGLAGVETARPVPKGKAGELRLAPVPAAGAGGSGSTLTPSLAVEPPTPISPIPAQDLASAAFVTT